MEMWPIGWIVWIWRAFVPPGLTIDPKRVNDEVRRERREQLVIDAGTKEWRECETRVRARMTTGISGRRSTWLTEKKLPSWYMLARGRELAVRAVVKPRAIAEFPRRATGGGGEA